MSLEHLKRDGIAFFTEAISKWNRLIELYNELSPLPLHEPTEEIREANEILIWFQDNYNQHRKYSSFRVAETLPSGKRISVDPIFDVIFAGDACMHTNASTKTDPLPLLRSRDGLSNPYGRRKIQRIQNDRFARHDSFGNGHRAIGDSGESERTV